MQEQLLYTLASVAGVSLLSFIGVLSLAVGRKRLEQSMVLLIAFASGTLLAAAFTHLIPEASSNIKDNAFNSVLAGVLFFFLVEKFIHWHHCGKEECSVRPVAYLNLIGDGLHNLIDGVIIAAAYLTGTELGIVTTIAIILHEIPQEFGDFSILIHSGMKTKKALGYNFLSATTAIAGAVAGYIFLDSLGYLIPYAIAVAAGGFIYIATADLMPELHKEESPKRMLAQAAALMVGVMVIIGFQGTHAHEGHAHTPADAEHHTQTHEHTHPPDTHAGTGESADSKVANEYEHNDHAG